MFLNIFISFSLVTIVLGITKTPEISSEDNNYCYCEDEHTLSVKSGCIVGYNCVKLRFCARSRWCVIYDQSSQLYLRTIHKPDVNLVVIENSGFLARCGIKNLPNLKVIHGVSQNLAVVEPFAFWNLSKLEVIDLSYNLIKLIQYRIFNEVPSVETLNLSWNEIEYIGEASFRGMTNLKRLDLSRNLISVFDAENYFSITADDTFALEELNLSHNKLVMLVNLGHFEELHVLDLSHNNLLNFLNNLHPNQWLTKLDLSDNMLDLINISSPDIHIDKLRIPFNSLNRPLDVVIEGRVSVVVLDGNPWNCETYIAVLEKFAESGATILDYNENEDLYFLTKSERENYPICSATENEFDKENIFSQLRDSYKMNKNPKCFNEDNCLEDMICRGGRCWDVCKANVCHESSICLARLQRFHCICEEGIPNPYTTDSKCYNVECFTDEDCYDSDFGSKCNARKHKCEE